MWCNATYFRHTQYQWLSVQVRIVCLVWHINLCWTYQMRGSLFQIIHIICAISGYSWLIHICNRLQLLIENVFNCKPLDYILFQPTLYFPQYVICSTLFIKLFNLTINQIYTNLKIKIFQIHSNYIKFSLFRNKYLSQHAFY